MSNPITQKGFVTIFSRCKLSLLKQHIFLILTQPSWNGYLLLYSSKCSLRGTVLKGISSITSNEYQTEFLECPVFWTSARIYRPSIRKSKPKTLVFSHRKRAFWACFRENRVYNFGHRFCYWPSSPNSSLATHPLCTHGLTSPFITCPFLVTFYNLPLLRHLLQPPPSYFFSHLFYILLLLSHLLQPPPS
jgi:hypothetical protein